jgi:hypothetical protein
VKVPVHCCCEPGKRLGWLDLPPAAVERGHVYVMVGGREHVLNIRMIQLQRYRYELLPCGHYTAALYFKRQAVDSEDRPLEFWRQVPGFEAL